MGDDNFRAVLHYHEATKHHFNQYARSPGHMDWANQPNPFRFYDGAETIRLPFLENDPGGGDSDLYRRGANRSREIRLDTVAGFLELSLGLSAWKAAGDSRWSLRINPSSGNLHPTEAHLILPPLGGRSAGVYHYVSYLHALELRAEVPSGIWAALADFFGHAGFLVALSSIFWRESWKYGERAFRYCNHDAGHALAALGFSGNLFGWKVSLLENASDGEIETLLGFDGVPWPEGGREHPDLIGFVHPANGLDPPRHLPADPVAAFSDLTFRGDPNRLSRQVVAWEIIDSVAKATRKPVTDAAPAGFLSPERLPEPSRSLSPAETIRQRRSAVSFDGRSKIPRNRFFAMLDKTLPRSDHLPFDAWTAAPMASLLLFVHRVEDLAPGLYFFFRTPEEMPAFRLAADPTFLWEPVEPGFPLYRLADGDFRRTAMQVSCHQEIAGFGAFSIGMIVRFRETLQKDPWRYRHLFWETGMIGQTLYLEAEAQGMRGTGIGCFFDDAVHDLLGLTDDTYQSLYHFTVGSPVEDSRLETLPPYGHLPAPPPE